MKVFQIRQSIAHFDQCAIRLTLILKSAQARCVSMYYVITYRGLSEKDNNRKMMKNTGF